jgi:methionyl-tRNA formyltransferase
MKRVKKITFVTIKDWNFREVREFQNTHKNFQIQLIDNPGCLSLEKLDEFSPDYVFFIHWSWVISKEIISKYKPIMFHMTELPFGRGGSPLQNLILQGLQYTKITALFVAEKLDTGDILLTENLSLEGSANRIYNRFAKIVFREMVPYILENFSSMRAKKQFDGQNYKVFVRRKPSESLIKNWNQPIDKIYDLIRMVDADTYPLAFIIMGDYKITFHNATFNASSIKCQSNIERISEKHKSEEYEQ